MQQPSSARACLQHALHGWLVQFWFYWCGLHPTRLVAYNVKLGSPLDQEVNFPATPLLSSTHSSKRPLATMRSYKDLLLTRSVVMWPVAMFPTRTCLLLTRSVAMCCCKETWLSLTR